MYLSRILPPSEQEKLRGTEAECLIGHLTDNGPYVLIVEKDDLLIGTWALMQSYHAECVWVHPDHRKDIVVPRKLIKGMMQMAHAVGVSHLYTSAKDEKVEELIKKLDGKEVEGKPFIFPVKGF